MIAVLKGAAEVAQQNCCWWHLRRSSREGGRKDEKSTLGPEIVEKKSSCSPVWGRDPLLFPAFDACACDKYGKCHTNLQSWQPISSDTS